MRREAALRFLCRLTAQRDGRRQRRACDPGPSHLAHLGRRAFSLSSRARPIAPSREWGLPEGSLGLHVPGGVIAPRPPGLVRGAGRGAGHLGQEELTGVRDFETINHALFLRSSLVGGPGSTHLSVFDSALRALCSTQRGLLVHVGRPHERGALRGERARRRSSRRARRRTRRQRRRGRPISRHRCRSRCLTRCSTGSRARRTRAKLRSDGPSGLGGRVRSPAGPALRRSTGVRARA